MKLKFDNEQIIEELQHASPVKTGKRFQSFFIDCLIVMIISYIFFIGANAIVKNTNIYKNAENVVKEEIAFYNGYLNETRVMEFEIINDKEVRKDQIIDEETGVSKIVLENINRAIYYSYQLYGDFDKQFGLSLDKDDLELIKTSISEKGFEQDNNITYFYTDYVLNSNVDFDINYTTKEKAQEYVQKVYRGAFGENAEKMFVFDLSQSAVPMLKTEAAYYIYYYIYVGSDSDINKVAKEYYYAFDTSYTAMLVDAEKLVTLSEPYYSTHYKNYYNHNAIVGRSVNIALLISIVFGYSIGILLPKLIFKHERTIGRMIFKLGGITLENEPVNWKVTLIKAIFECIGYTTICFLLYLFEPFNGSFNAMYMPFIGEMPLLIILALILAIVVINSCVMLFTRNKVGLEGLITNTVLVDRKRLNELDIDE